MLLLNGSMVQGAASPTLGQRLLRGRLGPLAAQLSSERFFRNQFGSIFSPRHPLDEDDAADQWSLLSRMNGQRLGHRTIAYMDERELRAERWHGAIRDWHGPAGDRLGNARPGRDARRSSPRSASCGRRRRSRSGPTSATTPRSRTRKRSDGLLEKALSSAA